MDSAGERARGEMLFQIYTNLAFSFFKYSHNSSKLSAANPSKCEMIVENTG